MPNDSHGCKPLGKYPANEERLKYVKRSLSLNILINETNVLMYIAQVAHSNFLKASFIDTPKIERVVEFRSEGQKQTASLTTISKHKLSLIIRSKFEGWVCCASTKRTACGVEGENEFVGCT